MQDLLAILWEAFKFLLAVAADAFMLLFLILFVIELFGDRFSSIWKRISPKFKLKKENNTLFNYSILKIESEKRRSIERKKNIKRLIVIITATVSILTFAYFYGEQKAVTTNPNYGTNAYLIVKLDSVDLKYNNSVGNDWDFDASVNNNKVTVMSSIKYIANTADKINFNVSAIENDTIPDKGSNSGSVDIYKLNLTQKNTVSYDVVVRENRGRYSGHTALWTFNFTVEREITLSDIVNNIF